MSSADKFEKDEANFRAAIKTQLKRVIDLRSKDREFHGLEREFHYHQAKMTSDFENSKDIKHPRDLGAARESILRKFLSEGGYTPKMYSISSKSVRVASETGHLSAEIDIAFFDEKTSLTLMKREDVYEVYPAESVYGVIQVKSILTADELRSALKNIFSFKRLRRAAPRPSGFKIISSASKSDQGFGVIFAYSSNIKWMEIIRILEEHARKNPKSTMPNSVFILDRGFFFFGDEKRYAFSNEEIESLSEPIVYGFPDRDGSCLYQFQASLLRLLRGTAIGQTDLDRYFRLPLVSDDYSYRFHFGAMAEMAVCKEHGDYARKISSDSLEKIIRICSESAPINWIKATNIAYGLPDDDEAYRRQPGVVRIYNPDNLPLSEILIQGVGDPGEGRKIRAIAFDIIDAAGMNIFLPMYYSEKESLISLCPKCQRKESSKAKKIKLGSSSQKQGRKAHKPKA